MARPDGRILAVSARSWRRPSIRIAAPCSGERRERAARDGDRSVRACAVRALRHEPERAKSATGPIRGVGAATRDRWTPLPSRPRHHIPLPGHSHTALSRAPCAPPPHATRTPLDTEHRATQVTTQERCCGPARPARPRPAPAGCSSTRKPQPEAGDSDKCRCQLGTTCGGHHFMPTVAALGSGARSEWTVQLRRRETIQEASDQSDHVPRTTGSTRTLPSW